MKKKLLLIVAVLAVTLTACSKDAVSFKKDYEALNGKTNANGKVHRTITIPKKNPIVLSDAKEIVKKIEDGETFYVYFGSTLCPWCRSVIEKALEIAKENGIKKIYYVDIWDSEGNEILRDKYTLDENNKPVKTVDGKEEYYKLLTYFDSLLGDYTYKLNDKTISYGEKRIFAPTFVYVEKGKAIRMTTGISSLQTDSRGELTEEILADEETKFDELFQSTCGEAGC